MSDAELETTRIALLADEQKPLDEHVRLHATPNDLSADEAHRSHPTAHR